MTAPGSTSSCGVPGRRLRGEDLLHYADVMHTSGRARREHLAWELLVALGPFAGEPATMRAARCARRKVRWAGEHARVDQTDGDAG